MHRKIIMQIQRHLQLLILIVTLVTFLKALIFPNSLDVFILLLLVLILLGIMR
ncbi:MAG: hypothetical protein ACOX5W_06445 [Bacillota bacterium]